MKENNKDIGTKYTPKKIRNTLFIVGVITAVLISAFACVRMYERDMNYWETMSQTEDFEYKSGNNGSLSDYPTAEDFAKNESKMYWIICLIFVLIGLLPGIASSIIHKNNPEKHIYYTSKNMGVSAMCSVFFVAIVLMFNPIFSRDVFWDDGCQDVSVQDESDSYGIEESDAYWDAKSEVKKQLKAPSTAKFCSLSEAEITRDGATWTVEGWVDAQNSFGAMLRNQFVVKITYTSRDTYNIEYCKIE